jgi:hypothetical protein
MMAADLDRLAARFKHFQDPSVANPVEVQLASEGLALFAELRELRADLESHHRYIAGLTGHACGLCRARGSRE